MENASKALLIAGGILLTMMVLALLVFVYTSANGFADSQDRKTLTKQIAEFNEGYEAYNKQIMYGTDIITVVNKAIDHNKNIEAMTTDPYYINIILNIKSKDKFKTTGTKVKKSDNTSEDMTTTDFRNLSLTEYTVNTLINGDNSLGKWTDDGLEMKKGMLNFFDDADSTDIIEKSDYTYYIYSGLTNFKKATFKCTNVVYNEETGRINEMTFEQIER